MNPRKKQAFIQILLTSIVVLCFIESIIALLQYAHFIDVKNKYFTLLGSFSSPNFLGAYLGLSTSILIWWVFVKKTNEEMEYNCFHFLFGLFWNPACAIKFKGKLARC